MSNMFGQGQEGDEEPVYYRPSSLCDSPNSSKFCEEMDKQSSTTGPSSSAENIDQLSNSPQMPFLPNSAVARKRVVELDSQLRLPPEPPPNKKAKFSTEKKRERPRKEEISENGDLGTVARQIYVRSHREQ
ncbi:hypothetical protein FO519_009938, partial [Halicephalobus sp. NKZ332]